MSDSRTSPTAPEPSAQCRLCPRLATFLDVQRTRNPSWFNRPVPSFGPTNARLLIVGLAPGLQGANRTGRPFTGDYAGDLLYETLSRFGFSSGRYEARPDDGLRLRDCMITNAVRCVPPENKPTSAEIKTCGQFLRQRMETLPRLAVILALGRIAHDGSLAALGKRKSACPFGHGAAHPLNVDGRSLTLFDSYHCSRYNTNTGRLTETMFHDVFEQISAALERSSAPSA